MNPQENIPLQIKRRIHLIDMVLDNLLPNMYPCDYNSSDHFVEGVLDEIFYFLRAEPDFYGIDLISINDFILDHKYDELTDYFNEHCIVLKNDNLQESIRRILREELESNFGTEKVEKIGTGAWALPYKNPMALIQKKPNNWDGLIGHDNGRLKFKEMKYGVRAGVKNLKNTYFANGMGTTTLLDLFKKYAPSGHGANNPSTYANFVANNIGVKVTDKLTWDKYGKKISKSIINFETGIPIGGSKNKVNGVTVNEFETGYSMANI